MPSNADGVATSTGRTRTRRKSPSVNLVELTDISRGENDKLKQLFNKYLDEAQGTEVTKWKKLSKTVARKAAKAQEKYASNLSAIAKDHLARRQAAGEDGLLLVEQTLWAWQLTSG